MKAMMRIFKVVIAAAALSSMEAAAQTPDLVISTFDTAESVTPWVRWWGAPAQTYEFDATMDASGNQASGSLKATIGFDLASAGGDNQFALRGDFADGAVDGINYTNLVFDIRWDGASPQRPWGDFGALEIGFRKLDFSQGWLQTWAVPTSASNGWVRVVSRIDPAMAGLETIAGIALKMWSGDPSWGQTGTATFWIDNVRLEGKADTQVPRPTLAIEEATPGLAIFASASGAQYQRQNIRTVEPAQSFVGAPGPVTYSLTIADYPGTNNAGFQTHMFLVPGEGIPNTESSPDWNRPDMIFLDIQNNAAGGARATFRHKIDQANGNSMLYNANPANGPVGALASVTSDRVEGTWSLTFNNNSVTITTPSGTSTNFTLSAATAARFADPMYAYFGIQPNQPGNIYESARFSNISITGVAKPISENFAGVQVDPENPRLDLDPAVWERVAENPPGVVLVPPATEYALSWTVPAVGFRLQRAASLTGAWEDVAAPATQIGDKVRAFLPATGSRAFYRLTKD